MPMRSPSTGKLCIDQRRQLSHDVVVHAVVARPGLPGGIDVKARPETEVPGAIGIIRHAFAAGTGIGRHDGQAQFRRITLGAGLGDKIFVGACEARQPVNHRHLFRLRLGWQENGEGHVATEYL